MTATDIQTPPAGAGRQPTREEAPIEETWNLDHLFLTAEAWEREADELEADLPRIRRFKGRLGESGVTLLACLRERDALLQRMQRVSLYANLRVAADGSAAVNQALDSRAASLGSRVQAELTFVVSEIESLADEAAEGALAEEPDLAIYGPLIDGLRARRPHRLSAETEEALAALGSALQAPAVIRTRSLTADLKLPAVVDEAGREVQLSIARYGTLAASTDREVRRRAHVALAEGMDRHKATLASTLATMMERNVTLARLRRYGSAVEMHLDNYRMPAEVYRQLLAVVHDEGAPHVRRLMRLRARVLGLERLSYADIDAPLDPGYNPATTYEEAHATIREALGVLGSEVQGIVDEAVRERWVDRADNVGKRNGAFSSGAYGVHPYVFLTWAGRMRNVFTLAHELGHAISTTLTQRRQPFVLASSLPGQRALFWTEAPSTACELLLGHHILSRTSDARLRRFVTLQFVGTFFHNMTTHLLEAHFEDRLYEAAQSGRPITTRRVMEVQGEVFERYFGDTVEIDEGARLYWMRQPHFYTGLYPISYSAGLACAYNAVEAMRSEGTPAVERWLGALSAPKFHSSLELMKMAGVDLADAATLRRGLAFYGGLVDELERSFA